MVTSPTAAPATRHRHAAVGAGVLLLAGVVTSLAATAVLGDTITTADPARALASSHGRVTASAVLQLATALGATGIAIALYPVLRDHSLTVAVGAVVLRGLEAVFATLPALALLALLAGPPAVITAVLPMVTTFRDAATYVVGVVLFGIAATSYYVVLHRARLLPRWLTGWGLLGVVLIVATAVTTLLDGAPYAIEGPTAVLAAPIALQEVTLGIWLLVRGFRTAEHRAPGDR